jgi:hypothetical protein
VTYDANNSLTKEFGKELIPYSLLDDATLL